MELEPSDSSRSRKSPIRSEPGYYKPRFSPSQPELLPRSVEEMVDPEDPVRAVIALIAVVDLNELESKRSLVGGIAYDPRILFGIWLLGLWDGERRSRRLERLCKTDLRYMLLAGGLTPDHSALCRFRREVAQVLPELLSQTIKGAKAKGLLDLDRVSIDGTRIPGASSQWKKLLDEAELADKADGVVTEEKPKTGKRKRKPSTDPEAKCLKTRKGHIEGYNAQAVVETHSGLLVATDVSASSDDSVRLEPALEDCLSRYGMLPAQVLADAGYDSPANAQALSELGITGYISGKRPNADLKLNEKGEFVCPHGTVLSRHDTFNKNGKRVHRFQAECAECGRKRSISGPVDADLSLWLIQKSRVKTKRGKAAAVERASTVELFFARLKRDHGLTRFLLRGLEGAKCEFGMAGLAHNLLRLLVLIGKEETVKLLKRPLFWLLRAFRRPMTRTLPAQLALTPIFATS